MKKINTQTCYMCEAIAETIEHVPPKCLFPEKKDQINTPKDLKKNLITIPSCKKHNNNKARDDEYLFHILTMNAISGRYGQQQFNTKVQRGWQRKPALAHSFAHSITSTTKAKNQLTANSIQFDHNRLNSSLEFIARGLYYHEIKYKFQGNIDIIYFFTYDEDEQFIQRRHNLYRNTQSIFSSIESKGDNPEIFSYKFFSHDRDTIVMLEMVFYETNTVLAIFKNKPTT